MGTAYDIRRIEVIDDATAEMFRSMTPGERIRAGLSEYDFARRMAEAGARHQHPAWTDDEIRAEVLRRLSRAAG